MEILALLKKSTNLTRPGVDPQGKPVDLPHVQIVLEVPTDDLADSAVCFLAREEGARVKAILVAGFASSFKTEEAKQPGLDLAAAEDQESPEPPPVAKSEASGDEVVSEGTIEESGPGIASQEAVPGAEAARVAEIVPEDNAGAEQPAGGTILAEIIKAGDLIQARSQNLPPGLPEEAAIFAIARKGDATTGVTSSKGTIPIAMLIQHYRLRLRRVTLNAGDLLVRKTDGRIWRVDAAGEKCQLSRTEGRARQTEEFVYDELDKNYEIHARI